MTEKQRAMAASVVAGAMFMQRKVMGGDGFRIQPGWADAFAP